MCYNLIDVGHMVIYNCLGLWRSNVSIHQFKLSSCFY